MRLTLDVGPYPGATGGLEHVTPASAMEEPEGVLNMACKVKIDMFQNKQLPPTGNNAHSPGGEIHRPSFQHSSAEKRTRPGSCAGSAEAFPATPVFHEH